MEIRSISAKIFKTAPGKIESNSAHTNPFGVNFQGNMIKADVFETEAKSNIIGGLAEKVSNRGKMVVSAIVGSMGDMTSAISRRLDSVVSFGKRIGETATKAWSYLNTNNLKLSLEVVERKSKELFKLDLGKEYRVKNLLNLEKTGKMDRFEGMLSEIIDRIMMEKAANAKVMEATA